MRTFGHLDDARIAKKVDVLRDEAAIVQVAQKVGRFMVPAHEQSKDGRALLPTEIPGEAAQLLELLRTLECIQIALISQRLKVASTED